MIQIFLFCYVIMLTWILTIPKKNTRSRVWNIEQLARLWSMQQHPLSACMHAIATWLWYYFTAAWYWKRHFSEEVQIKQTFLRTSKGVCCRVSYLQGYQCCRRARKPGVSLDSLCYKSFCVQILWVFVPKLYHLLQLLQNTIASMYTTKYRNGKVVASAEMQPLE